MNNLQYQESAAWNPFAPTQRDLKRTEKLAKKNPLIAGVLAFFFVPAAMIYLNRGINPLKIFGYALAIGMAFSVSAESEEKAFRMGQKIGSVVNIVIVAENINAVTQARKRQRLSGVQENQDE